LHSQEPRQLAFAAELGRFRRLAGASIKAKNVVRLLSSARMEPRFA
jgi:hypothetical protein